jgi:cyanophycin synthetase
MNLADELSRQARLRPDAAAICLPTETLSLSQLEALTWKAATYLHGNGVKPGDVVALSFTEEFALLVEMLATARIGATAFSLQENSPPLLRTEMAAQAHVHFYVTDHMGKEIAGLPRLWMDIDALAKTETTVDVSIRAESPQAPCLIITGSGSTGRPKFFAVTHAQCLARISLTGEALSLSPADRHATLIHLDFASAKDRCLATLISGGAVVLPDRKSNPISFCHEQSVTVFIRDGVSHGAPAGFAPQRNKERARFLAGAVSIFIHGERWTAATHHGNPEPSPACSLCNQ